MIGLAIVLIALGQLLIGISIGRQLARKSDLRDGLIEHLRKEADDWYQVAREYRALYMAKSIAKNQPSDETDGADWWKQN